MYKFSSKEGYDIEVILSGALTAKEFNRITEHLESLLSSKMDFNVLFDTTKLLDHYTFKVFLDEYDFTKKYKSYLNRVAFVSDCRTEHFLLDQFYKNVYFELKTFNTIDEARNWIAHS